MRNWSRVLVKGDDDVRVSGERVKTYATEFVVPRMNLRSKLSSAHISLTIVCGSCVSRSREI